MTYTKVLDKVLLQWRYEKWRANFETVGNEWFAS